MEGSVWYDNLKIVWGFCRVWKSPFYECISVRVVVMKKLSSCKGIIAIIVFSLIMICFASCQLWYQDLKGYLEHWSDTVSVEGSEWSARRTPVE